MTIETVTTAEGLEALREEWTELLRDSDADCLFLTWEWLATWWRHLARGRRLFILVARHHGRVEAIAPLLITPAGWPSALPFATLGFMGTGSVGSDYLDVIVRRGREGRALSALAEFLAGGTLMLQMGQVRRVASFASGLAERLVDRGWKARRETTVLSRFIRLRGRTWESYLAGLGREHRYNFRRRLRLLSRSHAVRFEEVRDEAGRGAALRQLIALHQARWRGRGISRAFHTRHHLSFHEDLSRLACERGWLRLFLLHLDDRPASGLYGFRYGEVFYFYQSGFDPAHARLSVGMVTMGLTIRRALEEGAAEYDLLPGPEHYKALWTRDSRELARVEIYPPRPRGAVYLGAVELSRMAKRTVRSVLSKRSALSKLSVLSTLGANASRLRNVAETS